MDKYELYINNDGVLWDEKSEKGYWYKADEVDARIQELEEEIRQAYYEGWGDAIRETGEEFYSTDMENNWLESETAKALKEGEK